MDAEGRRSALGLSRSPTCSTGVYRIPVFEIVEVRGFEVVLVNARDVKQVPRRKTDVNDARWLQQLHQYEHAPCRVRTMLH